MTDKISNLIPSQSSKLNEILEPENLAQSYKASIIAFEKPPLIKSAEQSLIKLGALADKSLLVANKKSATCLLASCLKFIGELSKAKSYYSSYPNTEHTNNLERAIANANRFLANQNICNDEIKRPNYYRDASL